MTSYYKVLTHEPVTGELLKPYEGVCPSCRGDARRALDGGSGHFAAVLKAIRGTKEFQHHVNGAIELLFEDERRRLKAVPARFRSIHVFRTLEACRRFHSEWRQNATGVFAVASDGDLVHHGFMEWLNATSIDPDGDVSAQLAEIRQNASHYWRSEQPAGAARPDALTETLLIPNVRVVAAVERF